MSATEAAAVATRGWLIRERARLLLPAAVAVGVAVRAFHILRHDFPLNDGGLFYAMAADIRANNFVPPAHTSYGAGDIPFAYPPLGLYAAALLDFLTPLALIDLFRLLPLIGTSLTVVAFALLARSLLPSRAHAALATLAFALIPRSFIWLLMGGGVTRSFGLALGLFALVQVVRLAREPGPRPFAFCALLSSATLLTHAETGYFLAFSALLFWAALGRSNGSWKWFAGIPPVVAALSAPWWGFVLHHHGVEPFLAAMATGESILEEQAREHVFFSVLRLISTSEPFFPILGVLAVLGALFCLVERRYLLIPAWWLAILVLDPRAAPTFTAVPVALLASIGLHHVIAPVAWSDRPRPARRHAPLALAIAIGAFVVAGSLITRPGLGGEGNLLTSLSRPERETMAWIDQNLPRDSVFFVVPDSSWQTDREGEWFPVLASRVNVVVVQGQEWRPRGAFKDAVDAYDGAWTCGFRTTACLEEWSSDHGREFTHVYIPRSSHQCCTTLIESLRADPTYRILLDWSGGTIFERRQSAGPG